MRTTMFRREDVPRRWYVIDADGVVLGRLASAVAFRLRGKHSPFFTPHDDVGDYVIVVNAAKVRTTGRKAEQKSYHSHSGYFGGAKNVSFRARMERRPEWIVERAVRGMLPKNRLGRKLLRKLHVYRGADHPHRAQTPETFTL
ncbi:MAG: 50S ribosomal protein L13 [Candidatus Eisenbacteria bacterium]|nr:50S ribosomal protein L13 [Candidatus Eisenbacteria bacterium]